MHSVTTQELKQLLNHNPALRIIDVRSPAEFASGAISSAVNIPTNQVMQRLAEFTSDQPTYIICQSGTRSKLVTLTLTVQGLKNLYNVTGGMSAWSSK